MFGRRAWAGAVFVLMGALAPSLQGCDGSDTDGVVHDGNTATAGDGDAGTRRADASGPESAPGSQVWGAGLGVTDLTAAKAFFVDFLDLEQEQEQDFTDRHELVLFAKNKRGSRVTLTRYKDGRSTENVAAKLLFFVKDTAAQYAKLLDAGYASNFPTVVMPGVTEGVAQIEGPEGYAIEISQYATDSSFFVSLGFAVEDPARSEDFYKMALGMKRTSEYLLGGVMFGAIELPDEFVVAYDGTSSGAALVLMSYKSTQRAARRCPRSS